LPPIALTARKSHELFTQKLYIPKYNYAEDPCCSSSQNVSILFHHKKDMKRAFIAWSRARAMHPASKQVPTRREEEYELLIHRRRLHEEKTSLKIQKTKNEKQEEKKRKNIIILH